MKHLVLGGARSGKSRFAERWALDTGLARHYVATAQPLDAEMTARVEKHRADRDAAWRLLEEPIELAAGLAALDKPEHCILVDCLTLWLSNCLHLGVWEREREALLAQLPHCSSHLVLVSNEVGLGVVPVGEMSRRFVDEAGRLHQELAATCDRVTTVMAGLPLTLKAPAS